MLGGHRVDNQPENTGHNPISKLLNDAKHNPMLTIGVIVGAGTLIVGFIALRNNKQSGDTSATSVSPVSSVSSPYASMYGTNATPVSNQSDIANQYAPIPTVYPNPISDNDGLLGYAPPVTPTSSLTNPVTPITTGKPIAIVAGGNGAVHATPVILPIAGPVNPTGTTEPDTSSLKYTPGASLHDMIIAAGGNTNSVEWVSKPIVGQPLGGPTFSSAGASAP
jgi:hypothetical protein